MKVKLVPLDKELEVTPEKTLLQTCLENGIEIRSICKGVPSCAECRIKVVQGESNVLPPNKAELNLIGNSYYLDGRRLSCQVRCFGNLTIDISEQLDKNESQNKKIRGFKTSKPIESQAVQDTMLLTEKVADEPDRTPGSPTEGSQKNQQNQKNQKNQPNQQNRQQGRQNQNRQQQGRNQNQQQGQNQRPQNQRQNRNPQQPQQPRPEGNPKQENQNQQGQNQSGRSEASAQKEDSSKPSSE